MEEYNRLYGHYPRESVADAVTAARKTISMPRQGDYHLYQVQLLPQGTDPKWKDDPFRSSNFYYNERQDCFYCPMGNHEADIQVQTENRNGLNRRYTITGRYAAKDVPFDAYATNQKKRVIQVNHRLNRLKAAEKEKLLSEEGLKHRSQRPQDVEAAFAT
jgi:hypothetical protein